eukprot:3788-Heterococcus_DN1.PRE.7
MLLEWQRQVIVAIAVTNMSKVCALLHTFIQRCSHSAYVLVGLTTSDMPLASRSCTALRLQYWHSYVLTAERAHLRKHIVLNLDTVAYNTAPKTTEHHDAHTSRAFELKHSSKAAHTLNNGARTVDTLRASRTQFV